MYLKKVVTILVLVLTLTSSVQAMVVPGRWDKVAEEESGTNIIVTLMTGDRLECVFVDLTTDSLIISTPDGVERKYRKSNVARITTADKRKDSLNNGFLIGAAVAGIPSTIIAIQCLAAGTCEDWQVGIALPIYVGIGAGIGTAVDAVMKDYVTLYEAPKNVTDQPNSVSAVSGED